MKALYSAAGKILYPDGRTPTTCMRRHRYAGGKLDMKEMKVFNILLEFLGSI